MKLQEFTSPGTYTVTVPPGSTVLVEAWGAGGGGGGGGGGCVNSSAICFGGSGGAGGSGAYVRGLVTTSPADGTLTVVVGAGGAGGAGAASASYTAGVSGAAGRSGANGGDTTISHAGSVVVAARGGGGGTNGGGGNISGAAGSNGQGGSGGTGTYPADSGLSRQGGNGGNATPNSQGPLAGQPGGYTANGMLPPAPNTGGAGGVFTQNQNPAGSGGTGKSGYVLLTVLDIPATTSAAAPPSEQIIAASWTQGAYGQTIDSPNSRATAICTAGALTVQVVFRGTNQPGKKWQFAYRINDGAPVFTGVFMDTDASGNAAGSFTVSGISRGDQRITVLINSTPHPGDTLYTTGKSIPFTC
ncbi:hypothetical protein [Herbidospora sp. NBRC 101105]|uniref:glycine-rich domain-containing protein n=1 Tax=Herbidospora sp. NBRC 101105 TaxID=3032195 RepID=UPI0024A37433|nr:hypothetical protein [Herbidospora sp. NBRC 101105]GLX96569.1 hypothetical protein Hesp01_45190 [Herbidospora sp. NBRC 101105]